MEKVKGLSIEHNQMLWIPCSHRVVYELFIYN